MFSNLSQFRLGPLLGGLPVRSRHVAPLAGIRAVPTIDLTDAELAAITAAVRRTIEDDRYPHAPRLVPMRMALGKLARAAPAPPLSPAQTANAPRHKTRA